MSQPAAPENALSVVLRAAERQLKARKARTCLKTFIEYCMPDPMDPDNAEATLYESHDVHRQIITHFSRAVAREILRAALSVPSQHGKTTVCAEYGLAHTIGNNPEWKIIYGTYSDPRAKIVGAAVRRIVESQRFKEVFPEFTLEHGSNAKDYIGTPQGGSIMFLGRNSGGAGNPCDLFVIDDPYKSMKEARSGLIREEVWSWYVSVVEQRCPAWTPIFIIHTRWSDDDLIARLCDPDHPKYDPEDNDNFDYLKIPGIIYEDQPDLIKKFGVTLCSEEEAKALKLTRRAGTLWPQRLKRMKDGTRAIVPHWPLKKFLAMRRNSSTTFSAMVMSDPVPPDGDIFQKDNIRYYRTLPENVRCYAASDHAVTVNRRSDKTCIGLAMVAPNGGIYIHRDLVWRKIDTQRQVEEILRIWKKYRPISHYAEGDHIKKSIGPILMKMARRLRIFSTSLRELPKQGDKVQKSQPIQALCTMGMLYLPEGAPWVDDAVKQMLRFDGSEGREDDFVDFLANLGRGLDKMIEKIIPKDDTVEEVPTGTIAWIKAAAMREKKDKDRQKKTGGW